MALALPHGTLEHRVAPSAKNGPQIQKVPPDPLIGKAHFETSPRVEKPRFQLLLEKAQSHDEPFVKTEHASEKVKPAKSKAVESQASKKDVKDAETEKKHELDLLVVSALGAQPSLDPIKAKLKEGSAETGERTKAQKVAKNPHGEETQDLSALRQGREIRLDLRGPAPAPKTEKQEDKRFTVIDRRTESRDHNLHAGRETGLAEAVNRSPEVSAQPANSDAKNSQDFQAIFQTVAGKAKDSFETKATQTPVNRQDAVALQNFLLERGHGQIVDQARIVLRDHNQGEIRLTLYPESLGKVKVTLNLHDNHLAGEISVENQIVKDVFQQNLDHLLQSFRDGGYQGLNIQVSVGGEQSRDTKNETDAEQLRVKNYGRHTAETEGPEALKTRSISGLGDRLVNLTA